jgi:hypothetical protein
MAEAVPAAQRFIAPVGLELKPKPLSAPQTPLAKQAEVVHPVVQTDPKAPERLPELHENVALPTEGEAPTTVRLLPSAIVVLPAAVHVFAPTVHTTVPGRTHDVEALVVAMAFWEFCVPLELPQFWKIKAPPMATAATAKMTRLRVLNIFFIMIYFSPITVL